MTEADGRFGGWRSNPAGDGGQSGWILGQIRLEFAHVDFSVWMVTDKLRDEIKMPLKRSSL